MRCKICKEVFKVEYFNQKTCKNAECIITFSKQLKVSEWERNAKKASKPVKSTKKTAKEHLQDEVNKLSRKIDEYFEYPCIDCGKFYGKQSDAAHYHNRGGNENIRYNLHNLHTARAHCNRYSSEHKKGYKKGLIDRYGEEYAELVETGLGLQYPTIRLNEVETKEALKIVRKLNREFNQHTKGNDVDGSMLREYFNNLIQIYK